MSQQSKDCCYRIDALDRITFVDAEWLRFARENEAEQLVETGVVGRSVWDFVSGFEVRSLYENLFASVRSRGEPARVPFRCDSPALARWM